MAKAVKKKGTSIIINKMICCKTSTQNFGQYQGDE